jgi:SecD/SecF fusion protein
MKSFSWKFFFCLVPCALAAWVSVSAISKYKEGADGGFKFGVDLVGGTILVYEIDLSKNRDVDNKFDPNRDINVLAEALKRRIDPTDTFNIVIRPAGGEGRVEIILPTGGTYRTQKAEKAWEELLTKMKENWHVQDLEVGRGKVLELADRIQHALSESVWEKSLFATPEAWEKLLKSTTDYWAELDNDKSRKELEQLPVRQLKPFEDHVFKALLAADVQPSDKAIESWVKKQAWEEMLARARIKWNFLEPFPAEMSRINPDSIEQLITFIQARGSTIGQAGLAVIEPLTGPDFLEGASKSVNAKEVEEFIKDNYGPSLTRIKKDIDELTEKSGRSKDLTVEQVQRIKDLMTKVGSLEFRILANDKDDKNGEDAAAAAIAEAKDLESRAKSGLPPMGPTKQDDPTRTELAHFELKLPHGQKSKVTYSWVELGPQERRALDIDNAARSDPGRTYNINRVDQNKNKAFTLTDRSGRPALSGALFYARKCEDRNLPDEERRNKEYEYFVLTRDPEFDPADPTEKLRLPKIDGSYLVRAYAGQGQDLRPAVHFEFNSIGGNLFGDITQKNVPDGGVTETTMRHRHLAIILDGLVMSAPTINSRISTQGQISGSFTQKEVENLVNILRAGRLPATLKQQPVSENTMGATLGQDTIEKGVRAVVLAFVAVLAFMIVYYRFAGMVASIALLANLVLTVGFMVAVQATFTLPGLAGLVLMLGMAVDANVLIYERLREERERGATLAQAIRNGYERALPTIIDTHLSSIFTAIVLYVVGNDQLKGFGVSLTVGLIISLFTSLFMTRVLFDYWLSKGWLHKLSMLRLFARPDIDFMGIRNIMFVATIALAIIGITLFIGRLPYDLNIDFRGGTAYGGKLTKALNIEDLREVVGEDNQKKWLGTKNAPLVTAKEEEGSHGHRYTLSYKNPDGTTEPPRTINLITPPQKDPEFTGKETPEEVKQRLEPIVKAREAIIQERATNLPDPSVEQIFLTEDFKEAEKGTRDLTPNFTVRTSENEPELVQATLDRLLRDKDTGQPLMKKVYMSYDKDFDPAKNRETRLSFFEDRELTTPATASPSFVKALFGREIQRAFGEKEKSKLPDYEIYTEGKSDKEGRYPVLRIKFDLTKELKGDSVAKIREALRGTGTAFQDRPVPDRLENFDSQLATETRLRALAAIVASWGAIMVYLWFRFGNWTFGLAAVICLIHDLFFTLGAIAACHFLHGTFIGDLLELDDFKIDLPAVAALLTLVGYSVNDTIVVFDRIREVRGKNPDLTPQMINDSVNQTLSRTVLASLTTWLVVFVLYVWGGPGVHLFAFVMVVGVVVGTYSSIYIASPLLLMLGEGSRSTAKTLERRPGSQPAPAPA